MSSSNPWEAWLKVMAAKDDGPANRMWYIDRWWEACEEVLEEAREHLEKPQWPAPTNR